MMTKKPLGIYLLLLLAFLMGGLTLFFYREPSNGFLSYLGYIVIFSGVLLLTPKKWARLFLIILSFGFVGFYLYFLINANFYMEEGMSWAFMGLTALFPTFIYSLSLAIYLLLPKVRQRFI